MNGSKNDNHAAASSEKAQPIRVNVFGRTDVGLVREHNEDNFLVADLTAGNRSIRPEVRTHTVGPKGSIFAVCDGMGGAAAGEVASQIGVDTIYDIMQKSDPPADEQELAKRLEKAICEAGRRILTAAKINRAQRGMGTTVTAATLIGPNLLIGQVGDSRAYILRNRQFVQVTKDQSLVQQLIDAHQMTEEEARTFDKNNIILQALGTAEEVHVDVTVVSLRQGDTLIMCSDGLSGVVSNDTIRDALLEAKNQLDACRILTEKACEGGGHDNITVIVATFEGDALQPALTGDGVDDQLVYRRYEFSRLTETNSRTFRPKKPGSDEDDTASIPVIKGAQVTAANQEPLSHKRLPSIAAAAALVGLGIAAIAYLAVGNSASDNPETNPTEKTQVTMPPVSATPVPAIPSKPLPPPAAAQIDKVDGPQLPPTAEESITGDAKLEVTTGAQSGIEDKQTAPARLRHRNGDKEEQDKGQDKKPAPSKQKQGKVADETPEEESAPSTPEGMGAPVKEEPPSTDTPSGPENEKQGKPKSSIEENPY